MEDGGGLEESGMVRVDQTVFRAEFVSEDQVVVGQSREKALDLPGELKERFTLMEPLFGPPEYTVLILEPCEEHVRAEMAEVDAKGGGCVVEARDRNQALERRCCADGAPIEAGDAVGVHVIHGAFTRVHAEHRAPGAGPRAPDAEHRAPGAEHKIPVRAVDRFGNTTSATIPLAMETARQEGKLKKVDLILIASVGAGFTVGAALLRWEIRSGVPFFLFYPDCTYGVVQTDRLMTYWHGLPSTKPGWKRSL